MDAGRASAVLRIGELSRRLGIRDHLLRAWERRYGLVKPVRTDGGQRMYRREEIELIERTGARRAEQSIPLDDVLHAYRTVSRVCWDVLADECRSQEGDSLEATIELAEAVLRYTDDISGAVAEAYSRAQRALGPELDGRVRHEVATDRDHRGRGRVAQLAAVHASADDFAAMQKTIDRQGELAGKAEYEEVAYLLLNGDLPDREQLRDFKAELTKQGTGSLEIKVDDPAAVISAAALAPDPRLLGYDLNPSWHSTYPILAWNLYWYYGDRRVLEQPDLRPRSGQLAARPLREIVETRRFELGEYDDPGFHSPEYGESGPGSRSCPRISGRRAS